MNEVMSDKSDLNSYYDQDKETKKGFYINIK